jgi:hypothetical protein
MRSFARYRNRAEQDAISMKTDLTTYENKRGLISELVPGPRYPDRAMPKEWEKNRIRDQRYNYELVRTSGITKNRNEARFAAGRINAHFKLEQLRKDVQKIRDQEIAGKQGLKKIKRGIVAPDVQIDDQFLLPYGAGYDHIIKARADLIDSQKNDNIAVMDELIYKLGYMDYRDALAVNKYILESKLHGDYSQVIRGQILGAALSRLNKQRRDEIVAQSEKRASEKHKPRTNEHRSLSEQYQMNDVMAQDAEVAEMYQD